ncbi:LysR family transcriptional regulator [Streptococcus orisratti]
MNIHHLREFITLAEVQNYLEAAEELFISQSTLSKHIQALEKESIERKLCQKKISKNKFVMPLTIA